jgi:hypothetical protein
MLRKRWGARRCCECGVVGSRGCVFGGREGCMSCNCKWEGGMGGVPFDAHFRFLARNSLRRRVDLLGSVKGNELDCTRRIRAKLNVQHVAIDRLHL